MKVLNIKKDKLLGEEVTKSKSSLLSLILRILPEILISKPEGKGCTFAIGNVSEQLIGETVKLKGSLCNKNALLLSGSVQVLITTNEEESKSKLVNLRI